MNWEETYEAWRALQPLSERDRDRLSRKFTVEFNYNSNHIEGNTLTYGQTELLLLFGKVVGEAEMKDFEEMKASNVGLLMMKEQSTLKKTPLTQTFIRQLHQTLLREDYTVYRTLPDGTVTSYVIHAGCYKTRPNSVITRYGDRFEYAAPEETDALMTDLVDWYNEAETSGEYNPLELAALFHYRYIRIHPFEDGNGRIARLLVNFILARHDYPMVVVRSRKKKDYLEALHQADLVVGPVPSDGSHASLREARKFVNCLVVRWPAHRVPQPELRPHPERADDRTRNNHHGLGQNHRNQHLRYSEAPEVNDRQGFHRQAREGRSVGCVHHPVGIRAYHF